MNKLSEKVSHLIDIHNSQEKDKLAPQRSSFSSELKRGGSRICVKNNSKINPDKSRKPKSLPPTPSCVPTSEIFASRRHSMDYVATNGVILRTGYTNKSDWYLLGIKELLDNAIDFLWKNYPGSADASVTIDITKA